ncbi:hypothetical protein A3G06_00495 [Candidatus Nomurabacteria bacterium RIFCSPLOWO2_12_FULL_46_14]|uniref:Cell division protein FtsL n=1 Tax=Candidatus Nomurabacteria bacterium RIFCSPLOWO2_12_FULL_46_14 TaxID=1801797 RepID=A0A1F6YCT1_9BACT|nr:MAG: hypothetical protein A3G06_00495 [Candidatus Nomurabacteria bacterium RIFCSPLOWO2_12_FULL_46_14]
MKALAIKIKNYGESVSIVNNNNMARRLLHLLLSSLFALGIFYILILSSMVYNIVERKTLEAQAQTIGNEVRELELNYLSLAGGIDFKLSQTLGFKEIQARYAARQALGSVRLPANEI